MRRVLLIIILLLLVPSFFSAGAAPQQLGDPLPNPDDYPEAGPSCKRRHKVAPWVGTPGVDWPNTFRCVLTIHTCDGVKRFTSGVRSAGAGMCDDYWRVNNALADREICCDKGSHDDPRPPAENQPSEKECPPPTSWLGDSSGCKQLASPKLVISRGTATLSMCGYAVFSYRDANLNDQLFADAYRSAMRDQLRAASASKVCCDKFRDAIRTRKPCDPRIDLDCDGRPNRTDVDDIKLPAIDVFTRSDNAAIDFFPGFDTSNPDFLPDRTARNSRNVGDCPCKWELVKGELNCSPDGKQKHHYKATWKCPKTGAEVITIKYAPATAPCERK